MIPFDSILFANDGKWHFDWDSSGSDTDVFDVYLNGMLAAVVTGTSYAHPQFINVNSDDPPNLEVVPTGTLPESMLNMPYVTFQWYGLPSVATYIVEQNIEGVWSIVGQFSTSYLMTFISAFLPDGSSNEYRVTGIDKYGQKSTPTTLTREIVRNPDFAHNRDKVFIEYQSPNIVISFEE